MLSDTFIEIWKAQLTDDSWTFYTTNKQILKVENNIKKQVEEFGWFVAMFEPTSYYHHLHIPLDCGKITDILSWLFLGLLQSIKSSNPICI